MKVLSLGLGGWLAERAGVEVVYYIGGVMLVLSGVLGMIILRDARLEQHTAEDTQPD